MKGERKGTNEQIDEQKLCVCVDSVKALKGVENGVDIPLRHTAFIAQSLPFAQTSKNLSSKTCPHRGNRKEKNDWYTAKRQRLMEAHVLKLKICAVHIDAVTSICLALAYPYVISALLHLLSSRAGFEP